MNRWLSLIGFLVLTIGGGLAIGIVTAPGEWYAALAKPAFNPPNWIFAPVDRPLRPDRCSRLARSR